jgi:imidazolonepropionase-like amidohydrolase
MSESITFENTFLIDGRGGDPLPDATVVVSEGTIREVRAHGQGARTPSGRVIDLRGKTLMPGLIDAHVHVGNIEVLMERTAALPPAVYVHRATLNLETDLSLGFTTLRDAGGLDWGFRAAIDHGLIRGPRLLLSVNMLTQTGGHGDKPGQWQFTVAELKAAVETAEAGGTYVMAHTYTPRAIRNCLEAGVRSLEHGNLLDLETAQQMAAKGAYLVPTLTVFEILAKEGKEAGMDSFLLSKLDTVRQGTLPALELARRAGVKIGSGTETSSARFST